MNWPAGYRAEQRDSHDPFDRHPPQRRTIRLDVTGEIDMDTPNATRTGPSAEIGVGTHTCRASLNARKISIAAGHVAGFGMTATVYSTVVDAGCRVWRLAG
jgi:hypothetical protein